MTKKTNANELLKRLNDDYNLLHTRFEDLFWLSNMGDHSVDQEMNKAQLERDAFRANEKLAQEVRACYKTAKGGSRSRLAQWIRFFDIYQTPHHALPIKKRALDIEARIAQKRSSRKEGYVDPISGLLVEASENRMRVLMRTHADEQVRKACFEALEKLPLDYLDDYIELIAVRNEFARALGHTDFYAYKARIDEDMSKKELFSIFESIYKKTKFGFKSVRKLEKTMPGLRKPWNFGYMMSGDFIKEEDPYFRFENVLSYWGRSFAALGIGFKGGTVTLDLLDRKGKHNNGFCHYPKLVEYHGSKRVPGSSNFTSNAIADQVGSGVQGIHTVFHEGGHAADRLNSTQKDACVNSEYPPSSVSWAEMHSMFMDSISSSVEWRVRYAKNEKGESYPFDLFERKIHKIYPLMPLDMMNICFVVFFEKEIYECKDLNRDKVLDLARKSASKYVDRSEDMISILNVPHIYSWESSAYYHGYGLADLGVAQWREYFFKKYGYIVDNPKVGKEMTKMWSYASAYPAKVLVKMATGKKLSADAFIRSSTRTLDEIIDRAKKRAERLKKVPMPSKPVDLDGRIIMVHGKEKIADNSVSFEDMDKRYRAWLKSHNNK